MGRISAATAFEGDPRTSDAAFASWLAERAGKLTASRMKDALDFKKDGTPSQKRSDYMRELLAERLTGSTMRHFVTPAMEWGLANEAEAKVWFTKQTGIRLRQSRFYDHPTIENCGATPDAETETHDDGLVEFKCPTTGTYIGWKLNGVVPPEHKPQMLLQLACTKRRYVMFAAYDPRIREASKRLFMAKFEPSAEQIAAVEDAARTFTAELDAMFDAFVTA
jgi:YqaJ-like viral recombinase domain